MIKNLSKLLILLLCIPDMSITNKTNKNIVLLKNVAKYFTNFVIFLTVCKNYLKKYRLFGIITNTLSCFVNVYSIR